MTRRCDLTRAALLASACIASLLVAGCEPAEKPDIATPLPLVPAGLPYAAKPTDAALGGVVTTGHARVSYGQANAGVRAPEPEYSSNRGGDISLDFADTDIREAAAQILGTMLHVNYTIDPGVHGTVTLHTAQPLGRDQLLPTLEVLLAQVGATLVDNGGLYRITASAGNASGGLGSGSSAGATIVPLHSVGADALAKVLQPYAGANAHIAADPGGNAIIVNADPTQREAIVQMIRAFDVDGLAGQSFALLPVDAGDAKDFSTALEKVLGADQGRPLANVIRVVPMSRIDAVLVVTPTDREMSDVRRVYGLVLGQRRMTVRAWHVYYLQNGRSNDVAYVLQQAFTPDHVTAQPTQQVQIQQLGQTGQSSGSGSGGSSGGLGGLGGGSSGGIGGLGSGSSVTGGGSFAQGQNGASGGQGQSGQSGANPLLGGLDQGGSGAGGAAKDEMRIIPADQNNAILIYGTPQEMETVQATLRKIDITPLQVRIDATVAEVELNNALEYGTQFFFKQAGAPTTSSSTGINLNNGVSNSGSSTVAQAGQLAETFSNPGSFAGFLLSGSNSQQAAINLLQSVSKVRVLSSPELVVLDNQPARLQVGNDVPILSEQSQSTITSNAPLVNSVSYVQTGVLLQITPRVNNDGQVTLDVAEEVSQSLGIVATNSGNSTTAGPASPTFQDRNIQSRIVVQDGQTVGLAGLIQDQDNRINQGVPYIRNIPVIGALFGQQQNSRVRTELLVMITPHVERDAHDARAITQDMEDQVPFAAGVPAALQRLPQAGRSDPQRGVLKGLGLGE